jgi:Proteasome assembly chaperone 3
MCAAQLGFTLTKFAESTRSLHDSVMMVETREETLIKSLKMTSLSDAPIVADSSSLPTTMSRTYAIDSIPTNIWVQLFVDRIVFGVSQLEGGRIGNFLLCQPEPSPVDPKATDFHMSTLLGARDDPVLTVYLRRITEMIIRSRLAGSEASYPTVVLGISLHKTKRKDPLLFRTIVELLAQLYNDAVQVSSSEWNPETTD